MNRPLTFKHDMDDKVTDVQFNPSLEMTNYFASGSQNGVVYVRKKIVKNSHKIFYSRMNCIDLGHKNAVKVREKNSSSRRSTSQS